jgi:NAD(P) transhydrogenase subunit alpha
MVPLIFIFVIALFLGFELISKIPSTLHTPLMSASNAIAGIILIAAIYSQNLIAIVFASANVVGGYAVTDRILEMFRKKK